MYANKVTSKKVTSAIIESIADDIRNKKYQVGDKLPSENNLCKIYGVSRVTIRNAIAELISINILESKKGIGTFVISDNLNVSLERIFKKEYLEIIELRQALEARSVELMSIRRKEKDLMELKKHLDRMEETIDDFEEYTKADLLFHYAIIKGSGNSLFVKIFKSIQDDFAKYLRELNDVFGNSNRPSATTNHRKIYEAIVSQNGIEAKKIVQNSMYSTFDKYNFIFNNTNQE